jgi:ribosome-binding protein aMBF1 (putative translation factor)
VKNDLNPYLAHHITMMMQGQDWETVYIRKKHTNPSDKQAVTHAMRNGQAVDTLKKTDASALDYSNRARKLETDLTTSALDEAPPVAALFRLSHTSRQELVKVRTEKGFTQQTLAQRLNVQPTLLRTLEQGGVVQDKSLLTRVNKLLGTHLKFDQ